MKLGVVLKFKNALASKVGSCPVCLHCIQCHKSSDILNPNNANIDSDRMTNTSKNASPQHEENHCKSKELLSFHLDMISASSKLDALRNNASKETTEDNVEHVEKEHDGEKIE